MRIEGRDPEISPAKGASRSRNELLLGAFPKRNSKRIVGRDHALRT